MACQLASYRSPEDTTDAPGTVIVEPTDAGAAPHELEEP